MSAESFTPAQKEAYRLHKMSHAYDRAEIARGIVLEGYHRAHPNSRRRPTDGILSCGLPSFQEPIKVYIDERGHEHHDRVSCKSWACPICADKLAHARAREIERAILAADGKGYTQLFATFTVPHRSSHTTAYVIERLNACFNKFLQRKPIRRVKRDYGYVGVIKCLDYTLTENGTHAHLHCVFVFDTSHDCFDMLLYVGAIFESVYDDVVFRETNQHISQGHGFNIEKLELDEDKHKTAERAARYAAKAISLYCVDHDKDKSKLTPFDLLHRGVTEEERERYLDFYKGQKGRRHVLFSPGLRDCLGIGSERAAEEERDSEVIATIEYEHAYFLRAESNRAEFERRLASGIAAALRWLHEETRKQQSRIASFYGDTESGSFETVPVSISPEYSLTALRPADRPAVSNPGTRRERSPLTFEDLRVLASLKLFDRAAKEYVRYLDRIEQWIGEERKRARKEKRTPRSGLGTALALADANDPRRDSLFYSPPEDKFSRFPLAVLLHPESEDDDDYSGFPSPSKTIPNSS